MQQSAPLWAVVPRQVRCCCMIARNAICNTLENNNGYSFFFIFSLNIVLAFITAFSSFLEHFFLFFFSSPFLHFLFFSVKNKLQSQLGNDNHDLLRLGPSRRSHLSSHIFCQPCKTTTIPLYLYLYILMNLYRPRENG